MCAKTKMWLIIAVALCALGLIIFTAALAAYNWDFSRFSTIKYVTNTHTLTENFDNILVDSNTADILFVPTTDAECKVVCTEQEKLKHSVNIKDGTLSISTHDERKWYDYIGIAFGSSKITVYLPEREFSFLTIKESTGDVEIPKDFEFKNIDITASTGDVKAFASALEIIKIKVSTGDINVQGISAGALELSVSTGKITATDVLCNGEINATVSTGKTALNNVSCKSLSSNGSTGDITLKNVIATENFNIKRSTGDVKLEGCDTAEIFIKTNTGAVKGTLLSNKIFITQTDTGKISVPKTLSGGKCEIITDTGDIIFDIAN